jgi:nucleolin
VAARAPLFVNPKQQWIVSSFQRRFASDEAVPVEKTEESEAAVESETASKLEAEVVAEEAGAPIESQPTEKVESTAPEASRKNRRVI